MSNPGRLEMVGVRDIPDYPIPAGERLDSHFFVTFYHNRWLNSEFCLKASPEVGWFGLNLFFIAQNQSPVGTLPRDDVLLAKLLRIDLATWQDLCRRDVGPLYNWSPCRCGDVVRLHHPVVTEQALQAFAKKRTHMDARARERERKRLAALQRQIIEAGGHQGLAKSADYVARLDAWLLRNCTGNRTPPRVREAMEALESGL